MTTLAKAGATVSTMDSSSVVVTGLPGERVVEVMSAAGLSFSELAAHRASLEEAYMDLTGSVTDFAGSSVAVAEDS
jgi:ABC-2 type transport system ATP-binding protein